MSNTTNNTATTTANNIINLNQWKAANGIRRLVGYNKAGAPVYHSPDEGLWLVEPEGLDEAWIERSFKSAINSWHGQEALTSAE